MHARTLTRLLARTHVRTNARTQTRTCVQPCPLRPARTHLCLRRSIPYWAVCTAATPVLPAETKRRGEREERHRRATHPRGTASAPTRTSVYVLCVHTYIYVQLADTHRAARRGVHLVGIEEDDCVLHKVAHLQGQVHRRRTSHAQGAGGIVRARPGARKVNTPSDLQQGKARREAERENHGVLGIHSHRRELCTRTFVFSSLTFSGLGLGQKLTPTA